MHRGDTREYLKNYYGAIHDYTKICELTPNNAEAYYYRANCENKLGDKVAACADWTKARELDDTRAYQFISQNCRD